jgi:hypothetical protein
MSSLPTKQFDAGKQLIDVLDFCKYKVKHNLCTMEEMEGAIKALESNMNLQGTISDFASFYKVPETTVRTNIFRKMFAKPKRKVLYPFQEFNKIVPDKWKKKE